MHEKNSRLADDPVNGIGSDTRLGLDLVAGFDKPLQTRVSRLSSDSSSGADEKLGVHLARPRSDAR